MRAIVQKGGAILERRRIDKVREILYCIIAFSLPFSILAVNISSILLGIILIVDLFRNRQTINYKSETWLLPILFITYAISLIYTENIGTGLNKLETKLSLLILPIIICGYCFEKALVKKILFIFLLSVTLAALVCILNAFYIGYVKTNDISILGNQYFYDRDFFVSIIGIRPPYFALYLATALIFLINFAKTSRIKVKYWLPLFATACILFTALLLTYSRMALLSLLLIFVGWLIYYVISYKKIFLLLLSVLFIGFLVNQLYNNSFLNRRIVEVLNTPINEPGPNDLNSVSVRYGQFYCALQIIKEYPIIGVGIGDTQEKLNDCYKIRNYHPDFVNANYNSHNQYLDVALSAGLLGLFVIMYVFCSLVYSFLK